MEEGLSFCELPVEDCMPHSLDSRAVQERGFLRNLDSMVGLVIGSSRNLDLKVGQARDFCQYFEVEDLARSSHCTCPVALVLLVDIQEVDLDLSQPYRQLPFLLQHPPP